MKKITIAFYALALIVSTGFVPVQQTEARELGAGHLEAREQMRSTLQESRNIRLIDRGEHESYVRQLHEDVQTRRNESQNVPPQAPAAVEDPIIEEGADDAHEDTNEVDKTPVTEEGENTPVSPVEETTPEDLDEEPTTPVVEETDQNVDTPDSEGAYLEALTQEIHRLTNIERAQAGMDTLVFDAALSEIATLHSKDMAQNNYFEHTSPDGCTVGCRFEKAGYKANAWGENIIWKSSTVQPTSDALAAFFVDAWMNSAGHRQNILSENYTNEGIGIALIGNRVYATANFSRPQ